MFDQIEDAILAIKSGKIIIVVDDENRENEGDFIMASEFATKESINFMATYGRGLICAPLLQEAATRLDLPPMVSRNEDSMSTAFTVSIDAKFGISTGISASDRARTLNILSDPNSTADLLSRPGHIFPLVAKDAGVLARAGHTEAAVDFARLAGLLPCGVICEILNDDGSCARLDDLKIIAKKHNLLLVSIEQLIEYKTKLMISNQRSSHEHSLRR